ncbi:ExeA family protein [Pleionea sp. CnH1-48]|uniref:ExeA family protein n=1 Tax=Pleionea sp. CnH1-48 TaxID=2954494 RepID=UPI0020980EEE|nr:AAA family ATPase [Pleionea sp. CnH1-48]MCO7225626.1 AAA family ATPase [Pleionea sp. CnH1-48]
MYESFFGLKELPFSIAPDPRYLFMSQRHKEALAHLAYGIRQGAGFVLLTGEVGTGKTTICRQILRKLPDNTQLAFILNPMLNANELLATLCDELGIEYDEKNYSLKQLTDNLTNYLLDCHRQNFNVVLMIDEAQNLAPEVLEQIRLLTNLETDQKKLLQIILVGQPELQELLARKELRQLAQRITARYHLRPLNLQETAVYIQHRLRIAGSHSKLFSKQSVRKVFQLTEGVPRLINTLCDRAMMAAYSAEKRVVSEACVKAAGAEVLHLQNMATEPKKKVSLPWKMPVAVVVTLIVGVFLGRWFAGGDSQEAVNVDNHADTVKTEAATTPGWESRKDIFDLIMRGSDVSRSEDVARSYLASRWSVDYDESRDGDFCRYVADYRLLCESGISDWQAITSYNRPAVLKLEDGQGRVSWVTLQGVVEDKVDIETSTGQRRVKLDWLLAVWTRQFVILWQAPPDYLRPIRKGDRGENVNWLAKRIAFVYEDKSINDIDLFDEYLQDLLMDFQKRHGLKADGIAGMNTLIQLNTSTIDGIPRLI